MTPPTIRSLTFDLDGTLLDTAPDMAAALNALRRMEGREPLAFAAIRPQVSHGANALLALGFGAQPPDELERLRRLFLDLYRGNLAGGTRLMAGFDGVLETLEAHRIAWGIVTNKPGWLTEPLLEHMGLRARAACVVAGDTLPERKPDPLPHLPAAALVGRPAADFVYVGDAERDIVAGRAAGMRTLAARFGYLAEHEYPSDWAPDGIVDRPQDILDWLEAGGD
jgi:phosphoglycolate phosphatase